MGEYAPLLFGGTQLAGGLLSSRGIAAEGEAAYQAGTYNARLAERAGYEEEARIRRSGARHLARRRVAVGASGLAMEGTPLEAQAADAYEIEKEALYARRAGLETARLDRSAARSARSTSRSASFASLLSSAGQAGATYYGLQNPTLRRY